MEQKKLFRTIENILKEAPKIENDDELLGYVLEQIINNEEKSSEADYGSLMMIKMHICCSNRKDRWS